eukprot:1294626-Rhodomonas_salina.1
MSAVQNLKCQAVLLRWCGVQCANHVHCPKLIIMDMIPSSSSPPSSNHIRLLHTCKREKPGRVRVRVSLIWMAPLSAK